MGIFETTADFRSQIEQLPREDILDIIRSQEPELIKQIRRIEWVFENKLGHLTWPDGEPITGRPLTNEELALLVDEPFELNKEWTKLGMSVADQQRMHVAKDPVLWAKHVLKAKPRVYQILMLRHPQKFKVLRAGRRLGKTWTMAVLLLHYAYTTKNGKSLVLTPMKPQAGLIYEAIMELAQESPLVATAITRNVTAPQYEIDFTNGSSIRFFTSGESSGNKSVVTRGQESHFIVLDELDYMADESLDALFAMMQKTGDHQTAKRLIGASTPSGRRGKFWEWCTDPKGTGRFREFWFPSYCNPYWDQDMEDFMHEEHSTEMSYRHEVEADWGEDAEGVYPRRFVDLAFAKDYEYIPTLTSAKTKYFIGVDWDKYGAGTNILVLEWFPQDWEDKDMRGKIKVCWREEIPKSEYTLTNAVDRIIDLNQRFKPDYIYVDRGYGETQVELLHRHGTEYPMSGLHKRVKGIMFKQSIEVRDPFTMQKDKKQAKHFMVDNLVQTLEKCNLIAPHSDSDLYLQLISFVVKSRSMLGEPHYSMTSDTIPDHAHDALILALMAITDNYGDLMKLNYATRSYTISGSTFMNTMPLPQPVKNPDVDYEDEAKPEKKGPQSAPYQLKRPMAGGRQRSSRPIRRSMF